MGGSKDVGITLTVASPSLCVVKPTSQHQHYRYQAVTRWSRGQFHSTSSSTISTKTGSGYFTASSPWCHATHKFLSSSLVDSNLPWL
jgi:hypothetical protein